MAETDAYPLGRRRGALRLGRMRNPTVLGAGALIVVMATLALGIEISQRQSRSTILSNLALRGASSATVVSTYLYQQADRQRGVAARLLASRRVSRERFELVVQAFGSSAAVLLDSSGHVLAVAPSDHALLGTEIASRYGSLAEAERGRVAVSDVVPRAVRGAGVVAIAVPFSTPQGRRVFSAAYPVSRSTLDAFVAHAIAYRQHQVFLVDSAGRLVAASPSTAATTLAAADPALERAAAHGSLGSVALAPAPTTFTAARVPGTPWRLVIAIPDSKLLSSIAGWARIVPWIVFALVSIFGVALVALFSRLSALSQRLGRSARTDSLTGLPNRRAMEEQVSRAAARARRSGEPMSVLMIDLDLFKQTNDRHGHRAGDRVLCAVAERMREVLRAGEVVGRWGGDEFIVLMPSAGEAQARAAVARLRESARGLALADIGLPGGVPMSIGAATSERPTTEGIVHDADLALYEAKARRAAYELGDQAAVLEEVE